GRTDGDGTVGGGQGAVQADGVLVIGLRAGGGDGAHGDGAGQIGRHTGERRRAAYGPRQRRGAGRIDGKRLGAVDRAAQRDGSAARASQRGGRTERDGIIIGLCPGGGDGAAVERGRARRVGGETREGSGVADCAA